MQPRVISCPGCVWGEGAGGQNHSLTSDTHNYNATIILLYFFGKGIKLVFLRTQHKIIMLYKRWVVYSPLLCMQVGQPIRPASPSMLPMALFPLTTTRLGCGHETSSRKRSTTQFMRMSSQYI